MSTGQYAVERETVPTENCARPMADVIPPTGPRRSSSLRALLESGERNSPMYAGAMEHSSDKNFKGLTKEAACSVVDSGSFRQRVVRSGGAVRRPAVPPRRTPFLAAESLVAPVSPSPTKDGFAIGDSNRNTN
jgi:hypothetical protein